MKALIFAAVGCLGVCSCTFLEGVDVDGKIYYIDPDSGAKGGIELVKGENPAVWLKLPTFSNRTGDLTVEIEAQK